MSSVGSKHRRKVRALNSLHNTVAGHLLSLGRGDISKYCEPTLDDNILSADPLRLIAQPAQVGGNTSNMSSPNTSSLERTRLDSQMAFYRSPGHRITSLRPVPHPTYISMSAARLRRQILEGVHKLTVHFGGGTTTS